MKTKQISLGLDEEVLVARRKPGHGLLVKPAVEIRWKANVVVAKEGSLAEAAWRTGRLQ